MGLRPSLILCHGQRPWHCSTQILASRRRHGRSSTFTPPRILGRCHGIWVGPSGPRCCPRPAHSLRTGRLPARYTRSSCLGPGKPYRTQAHDPRPISVLQDGVPCEEARSEDFPGSPKGPRMDSMGFRIGLAGAQVAPLVSPNEPGPLSASPFSDCPSQWLGSALLPSQGERNAGS